MFPPLEDWTDKTWDEAAYALQPKAFQKYIKIAKLGGISIPSGVLINFNPKVTFISESDIALYQRVKNLKDVEKFNSNVKAWSEKVENELRQAADSRFGHRLSKQVTAEFPRLSNSIEANIRFDKDYSLETRSVGFKLERHGVYLHMGAGKGFAGKVGSKWTDKYTRTQITNPDSLGKMGTGARKPVHWFNDVIDRHIGELADILADYSLDIVMNVNRIFLPE